MKKQLPHSTATATHTTVAARFRTILLGSVLTVAALDGRASNPFIYHNEGPFVNGPSIAATCLAGAPPYAVGYVAGLPFKKEKETAEYMAAMPAMVGMAAGGAPFCILKKVFYDCPKAIAESQANSENHTTVYGPARKAQTQP
ncbi:MAG: hypothetical protein EBS05_06785 [Proteobacteria bacterium]|nr:hypothetical protein [Pseudomonadota bacterium]